MYAMNTIVSSPYTKVREYAKLDKYNDVSLEIFYSYTKQERATDETGDGLEFSRAYFFGIFIHFLQSMIQRHQRITNGKQSNPESFFKG